MSLLFPIIRHVICFFPLRKIVLPMSKGQVRWRHKRPEVAKKLDSQTISAERKPREYRPGMAESDARQVRNVPNQPGGRGGAVANPRVLAQFKGL